MTWLGKLLGIDAVAPTAESGLVRVFGLVATPLDFCG